MNCRDYLTEFEERRDRLSQPAQLHLNDCPDCVKTSGAQRRVWQMIDGLRRVDAPKNFDFRVKARIAKSKPADFEPRLFPVLRYVLPLGLVVFILGALVFNTSYFFGGESSQRAETIAPTTPSEISPINSFATNQIAATNKRDEATVTEVANVNIEPTINNLEKQMAAVNSPTKSQANAPKKKSADDGIISRDLSVRPPPPAILPFGINTNKKIESMPNAGDIKPVTDVQILSFIGIETVSENGGKKVKFVKQDSMAERSDVRVGDVIEAIDGKRIGDKPMLMETFESKKLTVVRGAEKIEIVLQNKPN